MSLLGYGFAFASVFWAVIAPWWSFPSGALTQSTSLGGNLGDIHVPVWVLATWMVVLGTMVPFFLLVSALRHIAATRAGIVAMLEPVVGALVGGRGSPRARQRAVGRRGDRACGDRPGSDCPVTLSRARADRCAGAAVPEAAAQRERRNGRDQRHDQETLREDGKQECCRERDGRGCTHAAVEDPRPPTRAQARTRR